MNDSMNDLLPHKLPVNRERLEVSDQGRDEDGRGHQDGHVEDQEEQPHRGL